MSKKQFWSIILIAIAFLLFATSAIFQESFFYVTGWLSGYAHAHPVMGVVAFVGLAGVSALLSPFSSIPLVPSAVVIWGPEKTFMLLFAGWLIGDIVAYTIGYYLGYPIVQKIASKEALNRWVNILSEKVDIIVAFLFRLATPSEAGYIFGTLKYNFFKYFFITFFAELPFVYIAVYVGEAFVNVGWFAFLTSGIVLLLIVSVAIRLLNNRLKK